MYGYVAIPLIILLFVTPVKLKIRSFFNRARKYSATNINLFGFLLTAKLRVKYHDNHFYFSFNNKKEKQLSANTKKKTKKSNHSKQNHTFKVTLKDLIDFIDIKYLNINLKIGVQDDAMKTALIVTSIDNILNMTDKILHIDKFEKTITPSYETSIFNLDIDIRVKYALMEIIIIFFRILSRRRKEWKTLKT